MLAVADLNHLAIQQDDVQPRESPGTPFLQTRALLRTEECRPADWPAGANHWSAKVIFSSVSGPLTPPGFAFARSFPVPSGDRPAADQ